MRIAALVAAAAATLVAAAAPASTRSTGFSANGGAIRCAVRVPGAAGLVCAAAAIRKWQYDGRGIIRLSSSGRTAILRAGSDLLLAVDGDADHTARPSLAENRLWRAAGYSCVVHARTVTCRRSGHGFSISPARLARF